MMRRLSIIFTIVFPLLAIGCFAQNNKLNGAKKKDKKSGSGWAFYQQITKEYCPEAYYILNHVSKGKTYAAYGGSGAGEDGWIGNFTTVVHEACHGLNWDIGRQNNVWEGYFIDPGKTIAVNSDKVYNSIELNKIVPDSLKEKIYRYKTYIGVKQRWLASQTKGIYGLLDEFTAYYHGALAAYELKPWYEKKFGFTDPKPWIQNYIQDIGAQITAFYEFRIFIAWYLDYSRKKYPEQYKKIMDNKNLREAFTLLYDRFEKLAQQYEKEVYSTEKLFKEKGFDVRVEEKYFEIYEKGASHGYGHFFEEINWLKILYTPELATILKNFRQEFN